jgi:ketosteroid isomerase-like protein
VLEVGEVAEAGNINIGTFRGPEAVGPWLDGWFSSFERGSYRFQVEESIENGDRVYMTLVSIARGEGSGAEVNAAQPPRLHGARRTDRATRNG